MVMKIDGDASGLNAELKKVQANVKVLTAEKAKLQKQTISLTAAFKKQQQSASVLSTSLAGMGGNLGSFATKIKPAKEGVDRLYASVTKTATAMSTGAKGANSYITAIKATDVATQKLSATYAKLISVEADLLLTKNLGHQAMLKEIAAKEALLAATTANTAATGRDTKATAANAASKRILEGAARGAAAAMGSLWMAYGAMVPLMATFATVAATIASIKMSAQFESATKYIAALGDSTDESTMSLGELREELDQITGLRHGPIELAAGMREFAKAGVTAEIGLKNIAEMSRFATVAEMGLADATAMIIGQSNAFGESYADAANMITAAATASATSIGEMAQAMSQTTELGSVSKMKFEEVAAALAVMANAGVRGSKAGTSVRTSIMRLQSPTSKLTGMMQDLGVSFSAFDGNGEARGMLDMFQELDEKLGMLTDEDRVKVIREMFGLRALKGGANLIRMANQGLAEMIENVDNSVEGITKLQEIIVQLDDTAVGQWEKIKAVFQSDWVSSTNSDTMTWFLNTILSARLGWEMMFKTMEGDKDLEVALLGAVGQNRIIGVAEQIEIVSHNIMTLRGERDKLAKGNFGNNILPGTDINKVEAQIAGLIVTLRDLEKQQDKQREKSKDAAAESFRATEAAMAPAAMGLTGDRKAQLQKDHDELLEIEKAAALESGKVMKDLWLTQEETLAEDRYKVKSRTLAYAIAVDEAELAASYKKEKALLDITVNAAVEASKVEKKIAAAKLKALAQAEAAEGEAITEAMAESEITQQELLNKSIDDEIAAKEKATEKAIEAAWKEGNSLHDVMVKSFEDEDKLQIKRENEDIVAKEKAFKEEKKLALEAGKEMTDVWQIQANDKLDVKNRAVTYATAIDAAALKEEKKLALEAGKEMKDLWLTQAEDKLKIKEQELKDEEKFAKESLELQETLTDDLNKLKMSESEYAAWTLNNSLDDLQKYADADAGIAADIAEYRILKLAEIYDANHFTINDILAAWEDFGEGLQDIFKNTLSGLIMGDDGLNSWEDIWKSVTDNILQMFVDMLADMLVAWAASGLAELVMNGSFSGFSIPGLLGNAATGAVGASTSGGNLLTALGGALGLKAGASSAAGISATSAAATAAGGTVVVPVSTMGTGNAAAIAGGGGTVVTGSSTVGGFGADALAYEVAGPGGAGAGAGSTAASAAGPLALAVGAYLIATSGPPLQALDESLTANKVSIDDFTNSIKSSALGTVSGDLLAGVDFMSTATTQFGARLTDVGQASLDAEAGVLTIARSMEGLDETLLETSDYTLMTFDKMSGAWTDQTALWDSMVTQMQEIAPVTDAAVLSTAAMVAEMNGLPTLTDELTQAYNELSGSTAIAMGTAEASTRDYLESVYSLTAANSEVANVTMLAANAASTDAEDLRGLTSALMGMGLTSVQAASAAHYLASNAGSLEDALADAGGQMGTADDAAGGLGSAVGDMASSMASAASSVASSARKAGVSAQDARDAVLGIGRAKGGLVEGHASGGLLSGGTGYKDDIYMGTINGRSQMLMGGEYIVNADDTAKNMALLEAINKGRIEQYSTGGAVPAGNSDVIAQLVSLQNSNSNSNTNVAVHVYLSGKELKGEIDKVIVEREDQGVRGRAYI